MERMPQTHPFVWTLLAPMLLVLIGCSTETDEQLLAKLAVGLQAGSFSNQPEALNSVSTLLRRGNPKVKDPRVIDCLITTGALLLSDQAEWTDRAEARRVYNTVKRYEDGMVVGGLVRKVIKGEKDRLRVLFFGIKLGTPGSEERLSEVLDHHGDKMMAEDFLNSGSSKLYDAGRKWANDHGYNITQGMGSHRASWGQF